MKNHTNNIYDVIIVGAGPAGLSASLYVKRAGLKVLVIEKALIGGKVNLTNDVENYLIGQKISGIELAERFLKQIREMDIVIKRASINKIINNFSYFQLEIANSESLYAKSVIVATGTQERKLQAIGAEKYFGKGISYCGICDGPNFKNKKIAVVGGGNAAIEEAKFLASIANKLYLIHRRDEFRANDLAVNDLKKIKNVEFILNSIVEEVHGEEIVESISIKNVKSKKIKKIKIDGLFPYIGQIPISSILSDLNVVDENGYVIVDENFETNQKGLFAAGDVICKNIRQIAIAVGDGAISGQNSVMYVKSLN